MSVFAHRKQRYENYTNYPNMLTFLFRHSLSLLWLFWICISTTSVGDDTSLVSGRLFERQEGWCAHRGRRPPNVAQHPGACLSDNRRVKLFNEHSGTCFGDDRSRRPLTEHKRLLECATFGDVDPYVSTHLGGRAQGTPYNFRGSTTNLKSQISILKSQFSILNSQFSIFNLFHSCTWRFQPR